MLGFVALAYGISWAWLIPLAAGGLVVTAGVGWPTHVPALMGPLVAAVKHHPSWRETRDAPLRTMVEGVLLKGLT